MADDYSGWTLRPAAPEEYGGWKLTPAAPAPTPDARPSIGEALAKGGAQGVTLGFGDEVNGAIQALGDKMMGNGQGASLADLYRRNRDSFRRDDAAVRAEHPMAYGGGELAGGVASSFLPGLNAGRLGVLGQAALQGGLGGLGASTADTVGGDLANAGAGVGLGLLAGGTSLGLGKLAGKAFGKVAGIDEAVARKAAADAAADTASARSAAGRAAQDAYKQLEHLRELGSMRSLTPEQAQVAAALEQELGSKAQQKLLEAAAAKDATSDAFKQAVATEAQRAEAGALDKISPAERMRQLKARALRYGLPAVGGAMAGVMGFGGHGGLLGAGSGALMGAGLRPMMHSLIRMAGQPAVARPAAQFAGNALSGLAVPMAQRAASTAGLELSPDLASLLASLRQPKDPYADWQETP